MCEFCLEHGEGKKWYLQMKNYSKELLHAELPAKQKQASGVSTRVEGVDAFWENFVMPAITGVLKPPEESEGPHETPPELTDEEILQRAKDDHFGQVLPIEDVEKVIDIADSITRLPCGCRFMSTGKTDKRYCFGFGMDKSRILGKFPDAASSLEVLDSKETKKIFREYDNDALVHTVWTGGTPYVIGLCNCDRDCMAYKTYIEKRGRPTFFRGEYIGRTDWDLCNGCRACMSQCQFGAIFFSHALGKVQIDPTRCFGCGLCRSACPDDAITLVDRKEDPEAADLWLRAPSE